MISTISPCDSSESVAHLTSLTRKMKLTFEVPNNERIDNTFLQRDNRSQIKLIFPSLTQEKIEELIINSNDNLKTAIEMVGEIFKNNSMKSKNPNFNKKRRYQDIDKEIPLDHHYLLNKTNPQNIINNNNDIKLSQNANFSFVNQSNNTIINENVINENIIDEQKIINDLYNDILSANSPDQIKMVIRKKLYENKDKVLKMLQTDNICKVLNSNLECLEKLKVTSYVVSKQLIEEKEKNKIITKNLNESYKELDKVKNELLTTIRESDYYKKSLDQLKDNLK